MEKGIQYLMSSRFPHTMPSGLTRTAVRCSSYRLDEIEGAPPKLFQVLQEVSKVCHTAVWNFYGVSGYLMV